jgi:hypothetical protein
MTCSVIQPIRDGSFLESCTNDASVVHIPEKRKRKRKRKSKREKGKGKDLTGSKIEAAIK